MNDGDVQLTADALRVRFTFREDRFAHEVWVVGDPTWKCVLRSIEGSPNDAWPDSPPLQSVHREDRAGRQLALCVGMAGKSHWSASIELDPTAGQVAFDVACRTRDEAVGWLGNSYQLGDASCQAHLEASRGIVDLGLSTRLRVALEPCGQGDEARIESANRCLRVVAHTPASSPAARTLRWQFRLRLLADVDERSSQHDC